MPEFHLRGVGKTFDGPLIVEALRGVDLHVRDREFVCVLGPSGCGKSTLLDILAGLDTPTTGLALYNDVPIAGPDRTRGLVFQDPALFPWRTILENVALGPELNGIRRAAREVMALEALRRVGLEGFARAYPDALSGGMRQRAGIARALANRPRVLLMDEPFGAVDHLTRIALQEDLLRLWQQERQTAVFITHDICEAVFLADRVVLMAAGPGRVQEIFDVPVPRDQRRRGQDELLRIEAEIYLALRNVPQAERQSAATV